MEQGDEFAQEPEMGKLLNVLLRQASIAERRCWLKL
jgi:hypothetical protein